MKSKKYNNQCFDNYYRKENHNKISMHATGVICQISVEVALFVILS